MTDDRGVLGNLPRSRPGHRSEKRGSRHQNVAQKPSPAREEASAGVVDSVVSTVASVAGGGARAAGGIARELLRRLPRPL